MSDAEIGSKPASDQPIKVVMESETLNKLLKVDKLSRDFKSLRQDGRDLRKGDSIAIEAEISFLKTSCQIISFSNSGKSFFKNFNLLY